MPSQVRMLNSQIDAIHQEMAGVREFLSNPDSMRCCLNSLARNFGSGAIDILIVELEFFCEGAEDRCFEDECLVLRESVPRDS